MIPIENIYYMLSYSFRVLEEEGYKKIATEEFNNVAELCAAILIRGISVQLKRGLSKEYIHEQEVLSSIRGKIDISESIKAGNHFKKQMICTYDNFSANTYMNKILKSTVNLLIKMDITKSRKKQLKKLLIYFSDAELLDIHTIKWDIYYNKTNQTYRMLVSVCYLVIKGLIQTNSDGSISLMDFIDEQRMCRLYEKFILEYYRKEHQDIKAKACQIPWKLDDNVSDMLPVMQSDIMLFKDEKILIIDAKYYAKTLQTQYNTSAIHSANLYQIFTYVKNKEELSEKTYEVAGMLLYAKTDEVIYPDNIYRMSGNKIIVKTLDLNCKFDKIANQLDNIINSYFNNVAN